MKFYQCAVKGVAAAAGLGGIDIADHPHGGFFQPDADQLHAIVAFEQHLGEMRVGRDAADANVLHAEVRPQAIDDHLGVGRRDLRTHAAQKLLHAGQALGGRVDRTEDHRRFAFAGGKRSQGHDQILQLQDGASGIDAADAARGIGSPTFGRACQHDVFGLRIVEHVAQLREAGEKLHLFAGRTAHVEPSTDGRLETIERDFAKLTGLGHLGVQMRLGFGDAFAGQHAPRIGEVLQSQDTFGVDNHAVGAAGATAVEVTRAAGGRVLSTGRGRAAGDLRRGRSAKAQAERGSQRKIEDVAIMAAHAQSAPRAKRRVPDTLPPRESVRNRGGSVIVDGFRASCKRLLDLN